MPPRTAALGGRLPERLVRHLITPLLRAAAPLTSPLTPDDYLGLLDPLLDARHPAGRVTALRAETDDATTLLIRPGRGWAGHRAGQYLPVGAQLDGSWHWRTYSLTSPPERRDGLLTITVKAVPGGRVSPYLAHRVRPGTVLRLGPAQGEFTLPPAPRPRMLMITAGSGLTPVMGLLRTLLDRGDACGHPDVVLLHSAPDAAASIFRTELRLARERLAWLRYHEHHTRATGRRLAPGDFERLCPDWRERETWACGPASLLDAIEEHWGRAGLTDRLHVERFRLTPLAPAAATAVGGPVRFTRSGVETTTDGSEPLLEAGERAGVAMPYGCRRGICFGCLAPLTYGRIRDLRTGDIHDEPGRLLQTCVTAAVGPTALDL
ncbi:NADPH oxidoreductase [Streptomyces aureoverticillatus]|nr:NADPH oxidoreductase [Streptomyces aureoverticillatus]